MSIIQRARPGIRALKAYSSAHMEAGSEGLRLNANELPFAPEAGCGRNLNRYPVPQPPELLARMGEILACDRDGLLLTRGSDEAIDLLVRAFCEAGQDSIAITPPVFGMYQVAADIQGVAVETFPLEEARGFLPDLTTMAEQISPQCKLVFLCSPHNPIGGQIPAKDILAFCRQMAERALVVVDEAYVEFSSQGSLVQQLPQCENLAVLRTLSKAWGLAGARLGALAGSPALVELLRKVLPPYPIPEPVRAVVMEVTDPARREEFQRHLQTVLAEKARLLELLRQSPLVETVFPSEANFFLARFHDSQRVFEACRAQGLHLRDQSRQPGLHRCLRITVGSPEENRRLQAVLESLQ